MKPSERCSLQERTAQRYNVIWWYFQDVLADVFSDVELATVEEYEVYPYVTAGQPAPELFPQQCQAEIGVLRSSGVELGDNEKDLLDFLFSKRAVTPLFVVGELGSGKSSMLRNFFFRVLAASQIGLQSRTIYIDANTYAEGLRRGELSVEQMVHTEIAASIGAAQDAPGYVDEFWSFVARKIHCFAQIAAYIRDFKASVKDDAKAAEFESQERVAFARKSPFQYWYSHLLFLHLEKGMDIQVVLDNVDSLPTEMQLEAAFLMRSLAKADADLFVISPKEKRSLAQSGLKCIIAIRPSGLRSIPKAYRTSPDLVMRLTQPTLRDVLDKRVAYFLSKRGTKKKLSALQRTPLEYRDKSYRYTDIRETLDCLHRTLVDEKIARALSQLAHGSIRSAIALCSRFFRSHAIPDKYLTPALFSLYVKTHLPVYVFIRAILLSDYSCYREGAPGQQLVDIVNIFRAPAEDSESLFAPFRILQFLAVSTNQRKTIPLQLLDGAKAVYPDVDEKELKDLLATWLHYGLIESPEACLGADIDKVKRISITDAGTFYLTQLIPTLSYLECVKDDCDVNSEDIAPLALTEGDLLATVNATIGFCAWLLKKETEEAERLKGAPAEVRAHFRHLATRRPSVSRYLLSNLGEALFALAKTDKRLKSHAELARSCAGRAKELEDQLRSV